MNTKFKAITSIAAWPEAIQLMRASFDKFCEDDYELIAYVDTPSEPCAFNLWDGSLRDKAIDFAHSYADKVYVIPDFIHKNRRILYPKTKEKRAKNANTRASDTLQYAWETEISHSKSQVLLLDSDMFPFRPFSLSKHFHEKNQVASRAVINRSFSRKRNEHVDWLWSGLLFLDPPKLPMKEHWSFDCGKVNGVPVDVSGQTGLWLQRLSHPESIVEKIEHLASLNWSSENQVANLSESLYSFIENDDRNLDGKFFCEIYDQTFVHYRAGSNWRGEEREIVQTRNHNFAEALINDDVERA